MHISFDSVYVELTSDCMLSCPYCYHGFRRGTGKYFPLERYKLLLEELPDGTTVDLSGGEPILHPDIHSILRLTFDKGYPVRLITNGILLTALSNEEISLLDTISISLDGTTQERHDAIRGKGSFEKIEESIDRIHKLKMAKKISFSVTIYNKNQKYLDDFIQYALSKGVGSVNFGNLHEIPSGNNEFIKKELLSIDESLALYEQTIAFQESYRGKLLIVPSRNVGGGCPLVKPGKNWGIRIDPGMNVYPCEGFCGTDFSIGNLSNQTISELLGGKQCQEMVKFFYERINIIKECQHCGLKGSSCFGGCVADAFFLQPDCLCTDGACHIRRRQLFHQLKTMNLREKEIING